MRAFVPVLVLLTAAATPLQRGRDLARDGAWVELYLAYSAADPASYPPPERRELATLHERGARALETSDAIMAFSLSERACAFEESAERLLLLASTALGSEQRGSAERALRRGLETYRTDGRFGLRLGKLLLEEKDAAGAEKALSTVPAKSKESAEARALAQRARAQLAEERAAEQQARALEQRIEGGRERSAAKAVPAGGGGAASETRSTSGWESGVGPGGMRTRANNRFVFRYFNNERDFGQRAEYEGKIGKALDDAYWFTRRILGKAREAPVDVILYTREEFATHHGPQMAMAVAGFYSDNAIRMNDAAELNRQGRATLVHEYVHAAVDEFSGGGGLRIPRWVNEGLAEYVEWRFLGSEDPPLVIAQELRGAAMKNRVPRLEDMMDKSLIEQSQPALAYGTSAVAVRLLLKRGGVENLLGLIAEVGSGTPFEQALAERYDRNLERLNEEVRDELRSR